MSHAEATPLPLDERIWLVANHVRLVEEVIELLIEMNKDHLTLEEMETHLNHIRSIKYAEAVRAWSYDEGDYETIIDTFKRMA